MDLGADSDRVGDHRDAPRSWRDPHAVARSGWGLATPLLTVVSAQVLVLLLGAVAMAQSRLFGYGYGGEVTNAPVFALICPGVAIVCESSVSDQQGICRSRFGRQVCVGYWLLSAIPMLVTVVTILVFFRLTRGFMSQRASLWVMTTRSKLDDYLLTRST